MKLIKNIKLWFVLLSLLTNFNVFAEQFTNPTDDLVEQFFRADKVTSSKISLSGEYIAMEELTGKELSIVLINTNTYKKFVIYKGSRSHTNLANYHWVDNQNIVMELDIEGKGRLLVALALTMDNRKITAVNQQVLLENAYVENPLPHMPNKLLVSRWYKKGLSVYKIDLSEKSIEGQLRSKYRLNKYAPEVANWLSDYNGNLTIGYGYDEEKKLNKVWLKAPKSKKWSLIWQGNEKAVFNPVALSDDRKQLYVISNEKDDLSSLYLYNLESKAYGERIYQVEGVDLESAIISPDKKSILGVSYTKNGTYQQEYFSKLEKSLNKALGESFNDLTPYIVDFDENKQLFIVQTSDSTDKGTFHIFNTQSWELLKFASKKPWLKKYNLQQSKLIISHSSDETKIESYLTLPPKELIANKKPPLIVVPHGGPISVRDDMHFNEHVQFLAVSGFAVLQPNYRGSSGFGKKFEEQGKKQWGQLIEDDIDSAVNKVIADKYVDAEKVCIYGISYGGYSALISAVRNTGIYKCAASYAGVTDLPLLFNDQDISNSERIKKLMIDIVGDPESDLSELIEQSPVYQVEKIGIPVFLAQGNEDTRVDLEHFYRMKKTLKHFNKINRSLILENEGHGFTYINNLIEFYTELIGFFNSSLNVKSSYISTLENAANLGDKDAQNKLGFEYESGTQVKQDYNSALKWYEKAANQGLAIAQNNTGLIYDYGRGVEQDFITARTWYEKASKNDYAKAYTNLGYLYENGQGVEQDFNMALAMFEKAAKLGHHFAFARLGRLYENGLGVEVDIDKAMTLYEKSDSSWGRERYNILVNKA